MLSSAQNGLLSGDNGMKGNQVSLNGRGQEG